MRSLLTLAVLVLFAVGCATRPSTPASQPAKPAAQPQAVAAKIAVAVPPAVPAKPAVGQPVQKVLDAVVKQRIQFFDPDGKALSGLPKETRGSVSIHTKDLTGQDNYTFDEKGVVTKHLRSYGDDYKAGKWTEIR